MYSLIRGLFGKNRSRQVEVERKLTKLERTRAAVKRLSQVKSFDARVASSIQLTCIDKNIVGFIELIGAYLTKIYQGGALTPVDCFREQVSVSLDGFFTDDEGMYVRQSALKVLVNQADSLLTHIEALKKRDEDEAQYLERLLGKTFTSLISIEEAIASAQPK